MANAVATASIGLAKADCEPSEIPENCSPTAARAPYQEHTSDVHQNRAQDCPSILRCAAETHPCIARVERPRRIWDCKAHCNDIIRLGRAVHAGEHHALAKCPSNPIRSCAPPCRETSSA